jgi:tetratricopeptide (TPR) repeat protein
MEGDGVSSATREGLLARLTTARERRAAGDYAGAAALLRTAVTDARAALGPDAVELSTLLNELGIVGKYSGDFAEAETAYQHALAIEDRGGRAAGANAASILHNLAGLAHARGDAGSALPLALRGIDIRAVLPEPDPAGLAEDRAALAAILIDLGRYGEARQALTDLIGSNAPATTSRWRCTTWARCSSARATPPWPPPRCTGRCGSRRPNSAAGIPIWP